MKNFEKFSAIFFIAGILSFFSATLLLGIWPALMTDKLSKLNDLPNEIPMEFKVYYKNSQEYHKALLEGRDVYIKEACWHCHSQYVRPVGNESVRYGLVSTASEYQNILNRPQLFGTRRVGPDLTREHGKHSNDWHFAHLMNPQWTTPGSVMPRYPWYFSIDPDTKRPIPTSKGVALVAYLQSLGTDSTKGISQSIYEVNDITMPPNPLTK